MLKKILVTIILCVTISAQADSVLLYNLSKDRIEMTRDADRVRMKEIKEMLGKIFDRLENKADK